MRNVLQAGCLLLLALTLAGCSSQPAATTATASSQAATASSDAAASSAAASGSNAASAPTSELCALFTTQEIEGILGAPVGAGAVAGPLDTACQWSGSGSGATYAQIQVIDDPRYWAAPKLGEGYEELSDISNEAYVIPELGGWTASTLTDSGIVAVGLADGSASGDSTVQFLRTVLERL